MAIFKYNYLYCIVTLLFNALNGLGQTDFYSVSIQIIDSTNNKPLSNAQIKVRDLLAPQRTDKSGIVMLTFMGGEYTFEVSKKDFDVQQKTVRIANDTSIVIILSPDIAGRSIKQVEVIGSRKNTITEPDPGMMQLTQIEVQNIPTLGGEKDIVKGIQALPGVQASFEGSANIAVRGGSPDQNLYLLDDVRIYNTNHALGLVSSYNPALIKSVDFYRAGFPARYGGFVSAILDVKTKEYIPKTLDASVAISPIAGNASFSVPLSSNLSIQCATRRTFIDLIAKMAGDASLTPYSFSDYSCKVLYRTQNHTLSCGAYLSNDAIVSNNRKDDVGSYSEAAWGTRMAQCKYDYSPTNKINNRVNLYYSDYYLSLEEDYKSKLASVNYTGTMNTQIASLGLQNVFQIKPIDSLNINIGIDAIYNSHKPAYLDGTSNNVHIQYNYIPNGYSLEMGAFAELQFPLPLHSTARIGGRIDRYKTSDLEYNIPQPRCVIQTPISKQSFVKLAYTRSSQALQVLSNSGFGSPCDLWLPISQYLKPQQADQFSASLYAKHLAYTASIDVFLKNTSNVTSYLDGYSSVDMIRGYSDKTLLWSNTFAQGKAQSKGIEFFIEKSSGKFTAWISYTLSWAKNWFDAIDNGQAFNSPYDRRHIINIVSTIPLNNKWQLNLNWQFLSGAPISMPSYYYMVNNRGLIDNTNYQSGETIAVWGYAQRNNDRMKDVHHLDFGLKRSINAKHFNGSFEFGCYNVYNRKNPYYYLAKAVYNETTKSYDCEIKSISLFPAIPYISIKWFPFYNRLNQDKKGSGV